MEKTVEMALRVSQVSSTVFLFGESGVGKGMIAKLIHKHSDRSSGPFIRVDCAGIPESLMESELFGYEKGAFTGAKSEGKIGFFELADKGTLFLDEVGEVPLNSQSKLLRFLEDHEIIRVGGTEPKAIDVRIIAASNRDIEEMVKMKLFRRDLYYRLNVVPLSITPLREREEDIIPLIFYFLDKFNKAYHKKKIFSPDAIDLLSKYDFPGNVRELANLVERLVVVSENDHIETKNLPGIVTGAISKATPYSFLAGNIPLKDAVEICEGLIIGKTLKKCGSQREAARVLKIDQSTISRKIKKYSNLKPETFIDKSI
jgi:transcriptional regulator with PAS, ATPase and Fis domain